MFEDAKNLINNIRDGKVSAALRDLADLSNKAADLVDQFTGKGPFQFSPADAAALDSTITSLEELHQEKCTVSAADPSKMDPATILFIIKAAIELFKMIRERRNNG